MHECVDIRDCDQNLDDSTGERFGDDELIEIARVVVVDGRPEQGAQVADPGAGVRVGLRDRRLLVVALQARTRAADRARSWPGGRWR